MTTEMPRREREVPDATRPVPVDGARGGRATGVPATGVPAGGVRPGSEDATQQVPVVVPRRLGPYDLQERVGEGGMGVVWRAGDRRTGRVVAIKVLRPHIAHDEQARARLRREVHTLARVHHPRVASVIDADVDGPSPYIVTEFVPGPALDAVVDRDGPLRGESLLRVARGLAEALHAIHEVGIVHRDLKPGNVLLVGEGGVCDPVVIDFGIAQVADDVRLTSTGLVMGTPGYLSPEVAEGADVSRATDWWGWAATLAYAASGQPPFGRGPVTVVLDRVARGRLQLDGVDPQLRPLLAAALDPDPGRRPTEAQVLDGLQRYARDEDVTGALVGLGQGRSTRPAGPAEALGQADATQLHGATDRTRVAPQHTVARTRMAPQHAPVDGGTRAWSEGQPSSGRRQDPALWREPAGMPASWSQGEPGRGDRSVDHHPGPAPAPPPPSRSTGAPQSDHYRAPEAAPAPAPYGGSPYGGSPYGGGGATAYPPGGQQLDPRIGRSARTGTLAALFFLFVASAAVAPLVGWGLYAVWGLLSRTVDRTLTGLVLRRHAAGPRPSDVPMAVLASPWHLFTAALSTVLGLLLPVAMAVVTALVFSGVVTTTEVLTGVGPEHPLAAGIGALVGGWLGWWGLGSTSLRRGSRTLVRGTVPEGPATGVVLAVVLAATAGLGFVAVTMGDLVSWTPLGPGQTPLDLLPFDLP